MKYINLRTLKATLDYGPLKNQLKQLGLKDIDEEEDFLFDDEDEDDDYYNEEAQDMINKLPQDKNGNRVIEVSDFIYDVQNVFVNVYRISSIEMSVIHGVELTFLNMGNKNFIISYLSPQELFNLIVQDGVVINQEHDQEREAEVLTKLNSKSKG